MTGFCLTEFDPDESRQQLHAILKAAGAEAAALSARLRGLCPGVTVSHDPERELLMVAFPEGGEQPDYLRMLIELLDVYSGAPSGTAPELMETRLVAVPDEGDSSPPFSRCLHLVTEPSSVVPGEPCLIIEHGTSFGSGRHPSTRLAMTALERLIFKQADFPGRVLDVGCGSGILALACGLLGAGEVLGVDIDTGALQVAAGNAKANGLSDRVHFSALPLAELVEPFDLLMANVTGAVMGGMVGEFARLVRPGGWLVISGLQGRQLGEMVELLRGLGFGEIEMFSEGRWRAGLLRLSVADSARSYRSDKAYGLTK